MEIYAGQMIGINQLEPYISAKRDYLESVNEFVPPDGRPDTLKPFVQSLFAVAAVVVDTGDQTKLLPLTFV